MGKIRLNRLFNFIFPVTFFILLLSSCYKSNSLEKIPPEEAGFSSEKLEKVSAHADKAGASAIIALYDSKVFYSWGNVSKNIPCHSIRKPFLGALYGIFIERGLINPGMTVGELGIDDIPPSLTASEKKATVRDLLMSKSGIYHEAASESEKMKRLRPERGIHAPGTFFYYNNWDFNVLGTVFEKTTDKKIFSSFKKEIADKIGMEDFNPYICAYKYERKLSKHPAYIFRMSARDMARFGLLCMNYGKWKGKQIIPEEWIRESTKSHSFKCLNGDDYGYLWSIIPESVFPGGGFYHTGFKNHFLGILPDEKLVVVYRGEGDQGVEQDAAQMREILFMLYNAKK